MVTTWCVNGWDGTAVKWHGATDDACCCFSEQSRVFEILANASLGSIHILVCAPWKIPDGGNGGDQRWWGRGQLCLESDPSLTEGVRGENTPGWKSNLATVATAGIECISTQHAAEAKAVRRTVFVISSP